MLYYIIISILYYIYIIYNIIFHYILLFTILYIGSIWLIAPKNLPKQQFRWIVQSIMFPSNISKSATVNAHCSIPWNRKKCCSRKLLLTGCNLSWRKDVFWNKQQYCYKNNMFGNMQFLNSSFFQFSIPLFLSCITILSNNFTPAK